MANKLYNGNIAETFWSTATDGGFVRNYGYKYDNLNRLKEATYQKSNVVTRMYDENLTYDKNGNIMTLKRNGDRDVQTGTIGIDNLSYGYATNSNKLMTVVDNSNNTSGFNDFNKTGNDYGYDANGNLITDKNKKITAITYNHLNLPTKIVFPTGNIVYIYNASGQKVQKVVTASSPASVVTTDYLDNYQYRKKTASEPVELQFFPTAEGYVKNTPVSGTNNYSYVFNYTDHLGNVRLSYTKNPSTNALTILDENNYYPFGLTHKGYNPITPVPENRRLYNGKELQEELGLNIYDYGSRMYDPARAGWSNIDPLTEKMRRWSPYNYCFNNPMRFTDPDGMAPNDWVLGSDGQWSWRSDINSKEQAKAAGYSDYSDGKSNNKYSQGENTITLKENAKWVNSSNGIEKTAADKANPTEIAAVKVNTEKADSSSGKSGIASAAKTSNMTLDTEKINKVSSGIGLGNDVKSTILTAAGVVDDLGKYSSALKVIGVATGAIQGINSATNIINSVSKGEAPTVKDVVSFASGAVSVVMYQS